MENKWRINTELSDNILKSNNNIQRGIKWNWQRLFNLTIGNVNMWTQFYFINFISECVFQKWGHTHTHTLRYTQVRAYVHTLKNVCTHKHACRYT